MKQHQEKRWGPWLVGLCSIFLIALAGIAGWNYWRNIQEEKDQLTQLQILQIIAQHPGEYTMATVPPMTDVIFYPVEKQKEYSDTFVYAEVIGEKGYFNRSITMGEPELDAKLSSQGMGTFRYFEIPIQVIRDTEGRYQEGDRLTIWANCMFEETDPQMRPGTEIIVPVSDSQEQGEPSTRKSYGTTGFYYVTEDGYAIAAFDEAQAPSTLTRSGYTSGLKVDALLRRLKK
ncbi:MAG: hypothetical protein ACLRVT_03440 [Oscillospiraceae bacterium]